jgi:hypothetical protein
MEQVYAGGAVLVLKRQAESGSESGIFPTCINRSMGKSADYGRREPSGVEKTVLFCKGGMGNFPPDITGSAGMFDQRVL